MSRLRRPAIVSGVVGLLATVVVLAGAGAQEVPQVTPCDTVNETVDTAPPTTLPPEVPVTAPSTSTTSTTPSTLPPVPVETPTPAQLPEEVPSPPCQRTPESTLPPLPPEDDDEWEEDFPIPIYTSVFDGVPYEEIFDAGTDGTIEETAAGPTYSADTTDAQPIAAGEGGFRYAQVFVLPLLMLLLAAAVAWTLTQPVKA